MRTFEPKINGDRLRQMRTETLKKVSVQIVPPLKGDDR